MSDNQYDIRVVRLQKSTSNNSLNQFINLNDKKINACICLGHFDIMAIDSLDIAPESSPLYAVYQDSQSLENNSLVQNKNGYEDNYIYPLYILKQIGAESGDGEALKTFWEKETNYIVVTRLHCDRLKKETKKETKPNFIDLLTERCCSGCTDGSIKYDSGNATIGLIVRQHSAAGISWKVDITFYNSLELGDVVGIMKSDSLAAALEVQRHIYECKYVSDTYTYCGINRQLMRATDAGFQEKKNEGDPSLAQSSLGYISTRFSVKNANKANAFYEKYFKVNIGARYFVTGNADNVIEWGGCDEREFLDMIRETISSGDELYSAFYDVITRVGIEYRKPENSRDKDPEKEEFSSIVIIGDNVKAALGSKVQYRWRYPMIKLLGNLQTMYGNSVMDDLSGLLIPGVKALMERMDYLLGNGQWTEDCDDDTFEFLDRWSALINDISNLESQLVQHPEITPVRYIIPATVLQFEQIFIQKCTKLIQQIDVQIQKGKDISRKAPDQGGVALPKRNFLPILFPVSDLNASTQCLLDPKQDMAYSGSSPLCIYLPVERLYQPWEVIHILCHEAAHYCGDYMRFRKKRLDCLIQCTAAYLIMLWDAFLDFPQEQKVNNWKNNIEEIAKRITYGYPGEEERSRDYLRVVSRQLPITARIVGVERKNMEWYQNQYLQVLSPEEQLQHIHRINEANSQYAGYSLAELCSSHITDYLVYLCKECYADIVMILLLNCSFEDYDRCIFKDECGRNNHCTTFKEKKNAERHTDRIALVGLALDRIKKGWMPNMPNTVVSDWGNNAIDKANSWRLECEKVSAAGAAESSEKENQSCQHQRWSRLFLRNNIYAESLLAYEADHLIGYLEECAMILLSEIESNPAVKDELQELRTVLSAAKEEKFEWNEITQFVSDNFMNRKQTSDENVK